jgi:hypothetical protein
MGTAVDILLRAPVVRAADVIGWRPNPPGTNVNVLARQPFRGPNDVVGYPFASPWAFPSFSEDADPVSNIVDTGNMGSDQSAVSSTTYTFTTATTALPAGGVGILINVTDNFPASDGATNEHTAISGGSGVWTKLGEYTNSGGGAALGVTISVWSFRATANNPIGTVFTLAYANAIVEKASTMWSYSVTPGTTLILDTAPPTNPISNEVNGANDFGSISFVGLPATRQRLYFRGMGKEANSAVALTPSAGFTITGRTRSQNAASAVIVRGEFRISTSSGETSNPGQAVVGDTAGLFLALVESITGSLNKSFNPWTSNATSQLYLQGSLSKAFNPWTLVGTSTIVSAFTGTPVYTVEVVAEDRLGTHVTTEDRLGTHVLVETRTVTVTVESMAMSPITSSIATFPHAFGADLVYGLIWDVHGTDPITAETFTLLYGVSNMTITPQAPSGSLRKFRATGGTYGTYVVRHEVTLTSGMIDSRTVTLECTYR